MGTDEKRSVRRKVSKMNETIVNKGRKETSQYDSSILLISEAVGAK